MKLSLKASLVNLWVSVIFGITSWSVITPATIIILSRQGYSATQIGFFSALPFITIFFTTIFLTKIIKKLGLQKSYTLAMFIITLPSVGFIVFDNFYIWCFLSFLSGFSASILWVVTESYIADIAPKNKKGQFIGLFETTFGLAFASGPIIALLFNLIAEQALVLALILRGVSWGFFMFTKFRKDSFDAADESQKTSLKQFVSAAQFLIVASFLAGFYESGTAGITTLFALKIKISEHYASIVPGIIGLGSLMLQYPLGVMADKFKTKNILIICFLFLIISCAGLLLADNYYKVFWLVIFIWGAAGGGLYTLAMVMIGKQFQGEQILMGTVLLVISYTIGGFLAPALGGIAMDISTNYGITLLFLGITTLVFLAFLKSRQI